VVVDIYYCTTKSDHKALHSAVPPSKQNPYIISIPKCFFPHFQC